MAAPVTFNPFLPYSVTDSVDGHQYFQQGGQFFDRFGNVFPTIPKAENGYAPPFVNVSWSDYTGTAVIAPNGTVVPIGGGSGGSGGGTPGDGIDGGTPTGAGPTGFGIDGGTPTSSSGGSGGSGGGGGGGSDTPLTVSALTALILGLPTTPPATAGVLWSNSGIPAVSVSASGGSDDGGGDDGTALSIATLTALLATIPTTLPGSAGVLWLDNGVFAVS